MSDHQPKHRGRRRQLVIYSRGRHGVRVTLDAAPRGGEEVGRLIRRWQRRLEFRGERLERFCLKRKALPAAKGKGRRHDLPRR